MAEEDKAFLEELGRLTDEAEESQKRLSEKMDRIFTVKMECPNCGEEVSIPRGEK